LYDVKYKILWECGSKLCTSS